MNRVRVDKGGKTVLGADLAAYIGNSNKWLFKNEMFISHVKKM